MTQTVQAELLDDGAVVTAKIADGAVATAKVADSAITAAKLGASSVTSAKMATNSVVTAAITDANVTPAKLSQPLTQGTVAASTSGTSIDFAIPAWCKHIRMMLQGVSLSGTALLRFRLGTSGGIVTSGYLGAGSVIAAVVATANQTAGFDIYNSAPSAADIYAGSIEITQVDPSTNIWVVSGVFAQTSSARTYTVSGQVTLAGALSTVRLTTSNGTDTFDAGSINILYE